MSPELASAAQPSLSLIKHEGNAILRSYLSQSLIEIGRCKRIVIACDWFNDDGAYFLGFILLLLDYVSCIGQASVFFLSVFVFKLSERISYFRESTYGPVQGWNILGVH